MCPPLKLAKDSLTFELNLSYKSCPLDILESNPELAKLAHGGVNLHICGGGIKNANVRRG